MRTAYISGKGEKIRNWEKHRKKEKTRSAGNDGNLPREVIDFVHLVVIKYNIRDPADIIR